MKTRNKLEFNFMVWFFKSFKPFEEDPNFDVNPWRWL